MAVNMMVAFKAGTCAACGEEIAKGETFKWGVNKGDKIHPTCQTSARKIERKPADVAKATDEQRAIFAFLKESSRSGGIYADAGTGKTWTIEQGARVLPESLSIAYFVFNRANFLEADLKMGDLLNVNVSTFHRAGLAGLSTHLRSKPDVKANKLATIFADFVKRGQVTEKEADAFGSAIEKLVGLAKAHLIGAGTPDTIESWDHLVDHFGIEFADESSDQWEDLADVQDRCIEIARQLLAASNANTSVIDFDDMLYLTVRFGVALPTYDLVFIDESQDTNPARRAIARMSRKPTGRVVYVGDPRQAIYGFTGADSDSMDQLRREFDAEVLRLTVNWRCARRIIEEARPLCPTIQAGRTEEGEVAYLPSFNVSDFVQTDAILSRTNAPLVTLAFKFIARRVRFEMLGRDFVSGILRFCEKIQGKRKSPITLDAFIERLGLVTQRDIARWTAKGEDDKVQAAYDRADSIHAVIDALPASERTYHGLLAAIRELMTVTKSEEEAQENQKSGKRAPVLTLSSIHKSKGLQWDRVFLLNRDQMPAKWARKEWQKAQEKNLLYVAVTRAEHTLYFLDSVDVAS